MQLEEAARARKSPRLAARSHHRNAGRRERESCSCAEQTLWDIVIATATRLGAWDSLPCGLLSAVRASFTFGLNWRKGSVAQAVGWTWVVGLCMPCGDIEKDGKGGQGQAGARAP